MAKKTTSLRVAKKASMMVEHLKLIKVLLEVHCLKEKRKKENNKKIR